MTVESAFDGTIKEGLERRYTVINEKDLNKYLRPKSLENFRGILNQYAYSISQSRIEDGKAPYNNYIVINLDEPYVNEIVEIMYKNGHWDGALPVTKNVFKFIEEKQKRYYELQKELRELINGVDGVDVRYKGRKGMLIRIYTDSTADVLLIADDGEEYEQHVQLSELSQVR